MIVDYAVVFVLGALLGVAELVSRYRDDPGALFGTRAAYLYVCLNGVIGVAALYVLTVFPVIEPADPGAVGGGMTETQRRLYQIILAAFGGAAFFRSSIARARAGDMEVPVGPSYVIEAFLKVTDRAIDRHRASDRASRAADQMRAVPPPFAAESLMEYCIEAMQNLSAADEKALRARVINVLNGKGDAAILSMRIGMILGEYTGSALLGEAIKKLSSEIATARERFEAVGQQIDEEALAARIAAGAAAPNGDEEDGDGEDGDGDADTGTANPAAGRAQSPD